MRTIEVVKIEKYNLLLQLVCGGLIILACFFTKSLMWVVGLISFFYIFSDIKWEQKFAFFMFMLSFSPIFKTTVGTTSLFMFLRIAIILCYVFKEQRQFTFSFITVLISFFLYAYFISGIFSNDYLVSLINIVMWIMVGYVLVNTLCDNKMTPVIRSFSNGVIITGIMGFFAENIPQLNENIKVLGMIAEDGYYVTRYAGFWNDPNFFTVILIASLFAVYFEFDKNRLNLTQFLLRCSATSFLGLMTMSKSCLLVLIVFWGYLFISKNDIKTSTKVVIFFAFIIAVAVFLANNPYWISDILYRFTGGENELNSDILTTGRTTIWGNYFSAMSENAKWLYGSGINAELVKGKAAHNTILQLLYNLGIIGSGLYIAMIGLVFKSGLKTTEKSKKYFPAIVGLATLFSLFMFLDCMYIENIYYLLPVMFVYIIGGEKEDTTFENRDKVYRKPLLNIVKEV